MKKLMIAAMLVALGWSGLYADPPHGGLTTATMTVPKRWDADSTEYWQANTFYRHQVMPCSLNVPEDLDTCIVVDPPGWCLMIQNLGRRDAWYAFSADNTIGKEAYRILLPGGQTHILKDAFRFDSLFVWWPESTYVWANVFTPEGEGY